MYQQQYYYPATPFVLDSFIEPDTASNNNMSCFTTTDHDQLTNFYSSFPDPDPDQETYDLHHQEIPFQIHESTTTKQPLHHKICTTDEYHHPTSSSTMVVHELGSSSNTHPVEKVQHFSHTHIYIYPRFSHLSRKKSSTRLFSFSSPFIFPRCLVVHLSRVL